MPVVIIGSQRSGTSLTSRILERLGVYWGEDYIIDGDWGGNRENLMFRGIDNDLLVWKRQSVPHWAVIGIDWADAPASFNKRATGAIIAMKTSEQFWGWKCPYTTLTLPFWLPRIPGLKVLWNMRNPEENAMAISRHSGRAMMGSMLHVMYYQYAGAVHAPEHAVCVSLERWLAEPDKQLDTIIDYLGLSPSPDQIRAAIDEIDPERRRTRLNW